MLWWRSGVSVGHCAVMSEDERTYVMFQAQVANAVPSSSESPALCVRRTYTRRKRARETKRRQCTKRN